MHHFSLKFISGSNGGNAAIFGGTTTAQRFRRKLDSRNRCKSLPRTGKSEAWGTCFLTLWQRTIEWKNCDITKIHIYESLGLFSIFRNSQNSPVAKIQPISVNWWGNIGTVHSIQMLPNLFANLERFIWSHRSITVLICPHQFTLTGWFF